MTAGEPAELSDDELIERMRAGDRRAFGQLVRGSDAPMRRLAYRLLGSRSAMDDALQDAYLKAFRHIDRFDGRSRFSTWLYTITYRTCLDHLRARDGRREVDLETLSAAGPTAFDQTVDVGDAVATRMALDRALLALPPDQAAVVVLVDGEGRSYDEVAQVLAIAPGTVGSRLSRARSTLRDTLDADLEGGRP